MSIAGYSASETGPVGAPNADEAFVPLCVASAVGDPVVGSIKNEGRSGSRLHATQTFHGPSLLPMTTNCRSL